MTVLGDLQTKVNCARSIGQQTSENQISRPWMIEYISSVSILSLMDLLKIKLLDRSGWLLANSQNILRIRRTSLQYGKYTQLQVAIKLPC